MTQFVPLFPQFEDLNTNIVTISFGIEYWARAWIQETNSPFPVWLDAERDSYRLYGLGQSWFAAWGFKNALYYAKAIARGETIKREHRGDTDQMGGNFIIDASGIIRFAYPSRDPTDRPAVATLMDAIAQIERERVQ